jgi:hypothetical protein
VSHTYNKTCDVCGDLCQIPVCNDCKGTCKGVDPAAALTRSVLTKRLQKWAMARNQPETAQPDPAEVKKASRFADVVIPAGRPLRPEDFTAAGGKPATIWQNSPGGLYLDKVKAGGPMDGGAFNDRYPANDDAPRSGIVSSRVVTPQPMVTLKLAEEQQVLINKLLTLIDKQFALIDRLQAAR